MKRNLVKILAMSSMLLTLGACGSKKKTDPTPEPGPVDPGTDTPVEITIGQLTNLVDGGKWEYEGRNVIVRDLCVYNTYNNGQGLTLAPEYKTSGTDRSGGVEVELKEAYNFTTKYRGIGAKASVQGRVEDDHGHVVLKDAEVLSMSERSNTGSGGAGICVWSFTGDQREGFDKTGRNTSGKLFAIEGLSLVTKPEAYDGTKDVQFYVNFAGENPFVDDPFNMDVIPVTIPKGQHSDFYNKINNFFGGTKVGDQLDMYLNLYYYDQMQLYLNTAWTLWDDTFVPAATQVEVQDKYAPIKEDFDDKYTEGMIPLAEDDRVYRYDVADYWSTKISDLGSAGLDISFIDEGLVSKGGLIAVDMMTTYEHSSEMLDLVGAQFETAGYEKRSGSTKTNYLYRKTVNDEVVSDVELHIVEGEYYHFSLEMVFVGKRTPTESKFDDFAGAKEEFNNKVKAVASTFNSALPELPASPEATSVSLSWLNVKDYKGARAYTFIPEFAQGAFAKESDYMAYASAYEASLLTAGFKANFVKTDFWPAFVGQEVAGEIVVWDETRTFYNATTHELVFVEYTYDIDDKINGLQIDVLYVTETDLIYNMNDDAEWSAEQAIYYLDAMFDYQFDEGGHTAPKKTGNYYSFQSKYVYAPQSGDMNDLVDTFEEIALPSCAEKVSSKSDGKGGLIVKYSLPSDKKNPTMIRLDLGKQSEDGQDYWGFMVYAGYSSDTPFK